MRAGLVAGDAARARRRATRARGAGQRGGGGVACGSFAEHSHTDDAGPSVLIRGGDGFAQSRAVNLVLQAAIVAFHRLGVASA